MIKEGPEKTDRGHLIVISVDALVYEDIEDRRELPVFDMLVKDGTFIKSVRTIYPSLTHAVHAAIIAGQPAGKTGVPSNTIFTPGAEKMPWYNNLSDIKCGSIFDLTKKAGLTTAVCHWPVTARAGDKIDWLIPELMEKDLEDAGGDWKKAYQNVGTSECLMDILTEALDRYGRDLHHPIYDEVQNACTCEIIKRFKPDVLFTHPGFVDSERHRSGLFSPYVKAAVKKTEKWLEDIINATKEAGIYENTNFIVLSDHGHLNYNKMVKLNALLIKEGLISVTPSGKAEAWQAYAQSCDLSAYIFLKDPKDKKLREKVSALLNGWIGEGIAESFLSEEEAKKEYGLSGEFAFIVEGAEGIHFDDGLTGDAICDAEAAIPGFGRSAHGHRPDKGPQPVLIGFGPGFEKGRIIENGNVLEHYDLFKKLLNI